MLRFCFARGGPQELEACYVEVRALIERNTNGLAGVERIEQGLFEFRCADNIDYAFELDGHGIVALCVSDGQVVFPVVDGLIVPELSRENACRFVGRRVSEPSSRAISLAISKQLEWRYLVLQIKFLQRVSALELVSEMIAKSQLRPPGVKTPSYTGLFGTTEVVP